MMRRSITALALILTAPLLIGDAPADPSASDDSAAFRRWASADRARAGEVRAFDAFIRRAGYADLVPSWTLLRTERAYRPGCSSPPFAIPPRAQWPHILPALHIARTQVVPVIGPIRVDSAWRPPDVNRCSGGASRSQHLAFGAVDFVPVSQTDTSTTMQRLCARWQRHGRQARWGLGAYLDPARPDQNRIGRFHVDAAGWRTWGFDFHRVSSACMTR